MMTCFYDIGSKWQILLLVLSQLTVISLVGAAVLLFRHKCATSKRMSVLAALPLNTAMYVIIQLDSRITGAEQGLHLHIPYVLLLAISLLSLGLGVWAALSETRNRKTIHSGSIKEAFDNLPTGVCFFNETGLPVLCNLAMHRFSFAICGKDVQYITDLEECLSEDFVPIEATRKNGKVFVLSDGRAWQLEKRSFTYENGVIYTQYTALDVTDLYRTRVELTEENEQLRKVQAGLKQLSANMVAVTREEEILNTKMRVHDEMGRCLVVAQKHLREGGNQSVPESVVLSWRRAVSMLKYNNEMSDEDMLWQIRETCKSIKLDFVQTGTLPTQENAAYLLTCATRECVTNAARYAGASELYADFSETETEATVAVTNNGKVPDGEIVEGGGLSTLRRRVERAGGRMSVESRPKFKLTVTVPKGKEGVG